MELSAQARPAARERCPYCHDELGAAGDDERVECAGCGTTHHAACLEELGRCTVMGCGRELAPARGSAPGQEDPALSARQRAIRERIRARARGFVQEHFTRRGPESMQEARLRGAVEGAREAMRERRWQEALEFLRDLRQLEAELPPEVLARVPDRPGNDPREIARLMDVAAAQRRTLFHVVIFVMAPVLALMFWLAVVLAMM